MGYDYTVRGWVNAHGVVDLRPWFDRLRPKLSPSAAYEVEHAPHWFTVGGEHGNYLSFATESKYAHLAYLEYLSLLCREVGPRTGLVTITGEWLVDGRGQFILIQDGELRSMPLGHLLDVLSPWHPLYRAMHYMGRDELRMQPPTELPLDATLARRDSVKAWFHFRYDDQRKNLAATTEPYLRRWAPEVAGSVGFQTQYGHDCMILARDRVNAVEVVRQLAAMSADFPDSWGMLYASNASERKQQPVAVQNGKLALLPEIQLRDVDDALLAPYEVSTAYAGLGQGYATLCLKWEGDLDVLAKRVGVALDATTGSLRRREESDIGGPLYLMDVQHRTLALLRNEGQDHKPPPEGYAFAIFLFCDHATRPDALLPAATDVAVRLRTAGIEVRVDS